MTSKVEPQSADYCGGADAKRNFILQQGLCEPTITGLSFKCSDPDEKAREDEQ